MLIKLKYTLHERDLLLNLISIEPDIVDKLKLARIEKNEITIEVDLEDLDVLLGAIAADANHAETRKKEKELNALFRKADKVYQTQLKK